MAAAQNINMRVPDELLTSIDANATRNGQNRTEYILSWLPDTYQRHPSKAETPENDSGSSRR